MARGENDDSDDDDDDDDDVQVKDTESDLLSFSLRFISVFAQNKPYWSYCLNLDTFLIVTHQES